MKRVLLICLVLVAGVSLVHAQPYGGWVGVYADNAGAGCNIVDAGGVVQLYYYHLDSPGATAIEFMSDVSATVGWSSFGDQSPFVLRIGSFDAGVSIAYQTCLIGNTYLGSTAYSVLGQTPACTPIQITEHPNASIPGATTPLAVDCGDPSDYLSVLEGGAIVNDDGSCTCTGSIPATETSWGKVKALYR